MGIGPATGVTLSAGMIVVWLSKLTVARAAPSAESRQV